MAGTSVMPAATEGPCVAAVGQWKSMCDTAKAVGAVRPQKNCV